MQVKIPWRACVNADYFDNYGCPLFKTLRKAGVPVLCVSGSFVALEDGRGFGFDSEPYTGWNKQRMDWCARRHRPFVLDIPGLPIPGVSVAA